MPRTLVLNAGPLTIGDALAVARAGLPVKIGPRANDAMRRSRRTVEHAMKDGRPHYGINTGFGSLSRQRIGERDLATLQVNLVRSHAAGVGDPLPVDVVRAMMLLLAASLCRGLSGVRPQVAQALVALLNSGITPLVPSIGSVGASGDLAPLAHVALALIGEGDVQVARGRSRTPTALPAARALRAAGIRPLALAAKEGLALINGTHLMAAQGALLSADAGVLIDSAEVAAAMSIDACRATDSFLDPRLYEARPHPLLATTAARMRALLRGSRIIASHRAGDPRVQDPYSLRAAPTVLGSAVAALEHLAIAVDAELAAVTDNPLVFHRGPAHVVSGANFHGMPLAMPLDYLAIALAHVAGIAERRVYLLTGAFDPESHLRPFLATRPGLQSGLMIAQYTAAACVNEIIGLATPASVANIPTSAGMEDYNSFGPRAAAKARRALDLATKVVAVELLCAAEAIESHRPLRSGAGVERALARVRARVPRLAGDRPPSPDIETLAAAIGRGEFCV